MANFLSLSKIYKSFFQGDKRVDVLNDINFTFDFAKSYAIIGASGVGKSTLLHILAGVDDPTKGRVLWGDEYEINKLSSSQKQIFWNQEIGLIFQQPNLIEELTVLENVALKGVIGKQKNAASLAQKVLCQVGLQDRMNFFPSFLSKGEQQRVAIARAMMGKPKLILADEPSASLDKETGVKVLELLTSLCKENRIGLIIITHDEYVHSNMDSIIEISSGLFKVN